MVRVLTRAFLTRFFENDLTAGAGDLRRTNFIALAILAIPGVIAPVLMAGAAATTRGWAMTARTAGVEALREMAMADKTLYLGLATVIALLLTAITWGTLLPDRRDTLVLGPLPVRSRAIAAARLAALLIYAGGSALAVHALSAIAFGSLLAASNTLTFGLRGIAAHLVAACGVAMFSTLTVTAVQGAIGAVFGPRVLERAAAPLQWAVVATAALLLVSLSAMSVAALDTVRGLGSHVSPWILSAPPLWFLGLYERIVGTTDPVLIVLSNRALAALAAVAIATIVTQPIAGWRLAREAVAGQATRARTRAASTRVIELLVRVVSREPDVRAVAHFYLTSLLRGPRQRLALAAAIGLGMAWGLPGWLALVRAVPAEPSLGLVLWPAAALAFTLAGLRVAAALPIDSSGHWLFATAPLRSAATAAAVRRVVTLVIAPLILGTGLLFWRWWGAVAGGLHVAISASESWFLIQLLRWRDESVPGTAATSFDPTNLRRWWPLYLLALIFFTTGAPALEYLALRNPFVALFLVAYYLTMARVASMIYDRRALTSGDDDVSMATLTTALRAGGTVRDDATGSRPSARVDPDGDVSRPVAVGELFQRPRPALTGDDDRWFDGVSLRPQGLGRDLRLAARRLVRAPVFAVFAIATLAVGAGATAADYALLAAVAPRHVLPDADRLLVVQPSRLRSLSYPDFRDLAAGQTSFAAIGGESEFPGSIAWRGHAVVADGVLATGDYFRAVGITPAMGRLLQSADDRPDAPPVAVISDTLWRTRFGADPAILGDTVLISGDPYQVVGILPPGFQGLSDGSRMNRQHWYFVPHAHAPLTDRALARYRDGTRRDRPYLFVVGRLAPDVTAARAAAEIEAFGQSLDASEPLTTTTSGTARPQPRFWHARPWSEIQTDGVPATALIGYLALPVLVLLIACTNLANLVLSRGAARHRESAVCRALGASRWLLVRAHLLELGLIALAGGLGAMMVARGIVAGVITYFQTTYPDLPQYQLQVAIDWRAFVLVLGACLLTLAVAGLAPAIVLTRGGLSSLANDVPEAGSRWLGRSRLIAGQVAVSVVLLLVGALAIRSLMTSATSRSGALELDRLAIASVPFSLQQRDAGRLREQVDQLLRRLGEDPAVGHVAALAGLPDIDGRNGVDVSLPESPVETRGATADRHHAALVTGSPSMFDTLGISIASGRAFTDADAVGAPLVAVVNARLARGVFGTADIIGRRVRLHANGVWSTGTDITFDASGSDGLVTIVGVTADTASARTGDVQDIAFVPLAQQFEPDLTFIARPGPDAATSVDALATTVKTTIRRFDDRLAIVFAGRADVRAGATVVVLRMVAVVSSALAVLALMLAMSGLYGVLSHIVIRRKREMAIRLAIGAEPSEIIRLIMAEGTRPVGIGVAVGIGIAAVARLSAQPFVVNLVEAIDPLAVVLACAPLVVAAGLACYVPARRASRTDPNAALKDL